MNDVCHLKISKNHAPGISQTQPRDTLLGSTSVQSVTSSSFSAWTLCPAALEGEGALGGGQTSGGGRLRGDERSGGVLLSERRETTRWVEPTTRARCSSSSRLVRVRGGQNGATSAVVEAGGGSALAGSKESTVTLFPKHVTSRGIMLRSL